MFWAIIVFILAILAADESNTGAPRRSSRRNRRRGRKNEGWLEQAWFHDHNQRL